MNSDTSIILQARMGSSRLPGKVLMPFGHLTLLEWIIMRLSKSPWQVIVATSSDTKDDPIENLCLRKGVKFFRGSEDDVLDRYYKCALDSNVSHIIRLTADNPFPDLEMLFKLFQNHLIYQCDYSHSFGLLPIGAGAEIFKADVLRYIWENSSIPAHREHVNEYILENQSKFRIGKINPPAEKIAPHISLTIDTENDYHRVAANITENDLMISTEELIRRHS